MAACRRLDGRTEPRIRVHRTRVPAARTKVVLTTCALLVVPGYRLLFFEQPLHGHGKHRMRSVITLMPAHLIAHSLSVPSAAVPAIPNPLPCPVLRRQGARRENLHVLGHRRKRCRKPARQSG